jgi:hypothetical protein
VSSEKQLKRRLIAMNMRTKMPVAGLASILVLGTALRVHSQDESQSTPRQQTHSLGDVDKGMSNTARDYATQKKALAQEFKDRRQALTGGEDWKSLSSADKKTRLNALQQEFNTREAALRDDYKAKREELVNEKNSIKATEDANNAQTRAAEEKTGHSAGSMGRAGAGRGRH